MQHWYPIAYRLTVLTAQKTGKGLGQLLSSAREMQALVLKHSKVTSSPEPVVYIMGSTREKRQGFTYKEIPLTLACSHMTHAGTKAIQKCGQLLHTCLQVKSQIQAYLGNRWSWTLWLNSAEPSRSSGTPWVRLEKNRSAISPRAVWNVSQFSGSDS